MKQPSIEDQVTRYTESVYATQGNVRAIEAHVRELVTAEREFAADNLEKAKKTTRK